MFFFRFHRDGVYLAFVFSATAGETTFSPSIFRCCFRWFLRNLQLLFFDGGKSRFMLISRKQIEIEAKRDLESLRRRNEFRARNKKSFQRQKRVEQSIAVNRETIENGNHIGELINFYSDQE
jgi:hypothetical protein